jgi:hypothetical protein
MAIETRFKRKLDSLWHRRTERLRSLVIQRGQGQPPIFTRALRDRLIADLLLDAMSIVLKRDGWRELREAIQGRKLWHIRGRGVVNRGDQLAKWVDALPKGPIVYGFWKGKRCLYIGKGGTQGRLYSYMKSVYLLEADTVEVYRLYNKSQLPKVECLATHLFAPRDHKVKPSKAKWGKLCPVCEVHDTIRAELRQLFKMK